MSTILDRLIDGLRAVGLSGGAAWFCLLISVPALAGLISYAIAGWRAAGIATLVAVVLWAIVIGIATASEIRG